MKIKQLLILPLLLLCAPEPVADEKRVDKIAEQLMCPVCAGQSVAESNSDLAKDMRKLIAEKILEGETNEEVISYFRGKYGDTILASPPLKGFGLFIWLTPVVFLLSGSAYALFYIRNKTRK